jgi:hypothetical protein
LSGPHDAAEQGKDIVTAKNPTAIKPPAHTPAVTPPAAQAAPATPAAPASPAPTPPTTTSLITATANGSNHGTKVDLQAVYQAVVNGLLTFYQPTDIFQMAAGTYTRDELIAEFQSFVTAAQTTKATNQQWRAAIQTERGLELHVRELRSGVSGITQARFGKNGAQNLQFGFDLPKPRTKSAQTKAVAVEKSRATRTERHTLGSVQKKDIKGNVNVALVVTPGTDGAQTTAAPAAAQPVAAVAPPQVAQVAAPAVANGAAPVAAPVAVPTAGGAVAPAPGVAGH